MFVIEKLEETDIGRRCGSCKSEENLRVLKMKEAGIQNNFTEESIVTTVWNN